MLPGSGMVPPGGAAGAGPASLGLGSTLQVRTTGPNMLQTAKMGLDMLATGQGPALSELTDQRLSTVLSIHSFKCVIVFKEPEFLNVFVSFLWWRVF